MATEQGILQALWGEIRPAVEARAGAEVRPFVALVNRHKTAEVLLRFSEALSAPPNQEGYALTGLIARSGIPAPSRDVPEPGLRAQVWEALVQSDPQRWGNCRLFLDDPLPDRIWLLRKGVWVLYRWAGDRFVGTPLSQVRGQVEAGQFSGMETMLTISVSGVALPNPKLPR
jgi:hypothetical protein